MIEREEQYKRAVLWDSVSSETVQCKLCAWRCRIAKGQTGRCRVRKNIGGVLVSLNYDRLCAANPDPIEKAAFSFQPGSKSFPLPRRAAIFSVFSARTGRSAKFPKRM